MIINKLTMKNFKRFKDEKIEFKDGITGILGNNGTGKSSIVEAIFFALYGVQSTGIQSDFVVSSFSPKGKCEVELEFSIEGTDYTVLRTFRKTKHDVVLNQGDTLLAAGVSQVEIEIRRILGMGPVDFRNTIYAAQKDLLTLLENTPGKRKEWFLKALGIDYIKFESDKILKERVDRKESEVISIEGELKALSGRCEQINLDNVFSGICEIENQIKDIELNKVRLNEQKDKVSAGISTFSQVKEEFTKLTERHNSTTREVDEITNKIGQIEIKITTSESLEKEYKKLESGLSGYDDKRSKLEKMREIKFEYDKLCRELQFINQENDELNKRVKKEKIKLDSIEEVLTITGIAKTNLKNIFGIAGDDLIEQLTGLESETHTSLGSISARIDGLESAKEKLLADWNVIKLAGESGECPTCHQPLGSHLNEIEEMFSTKLCEIVQEVLCVKSDQVEKTTLRDLIGSYKADITLIKTETDLVSDSKSIEKDIIELNSQIYLKEEQTQTTSDKISQLNYNEGDYTNLLYEVSECEKLQRKFIEAGKQISEISGLRNQISDLEVSINTKRDLLGKLESGISLLNFNKDAGVKLEQDRNEIESQLNTIGSNSAALSEKLKQLENQVDLIEKEKSNLEEIQFKAISLREEIESLKLTRQTINDFVIYLLQVVREQIQSEVSKIISEITGGRYEQVILDEEFNLLVRDVDSDYPIGRFSGGEQDDIAIALRIALSRYLSEVNKVHESTLLVFDEIFGSQDEERRSNLLTALRTQESRFPQILLISHMSEVQGEFTNTLMVEAGADMMSSVREV